MINDDFWEQQRAAQKAAGGSEDARIAHDVLRYFADSDRSGTAKMQAGIHLGLEIMVADPAAGRRLLDAYRGAVTSPPGGPLDQDEDVMQPAARAIARTIRKYMR